MAGVISFRGVCNGQTQDVRETTNVKSLDWKRLIVKDAKRIKIGIAYRNRALCGPWECSLRWTWEVSGGMPPVV